MIGKDRRHLDFILIFIGRLCFIVKASQLCWRMDLKWRAQVCVKRKFAFVCCFVEVLNCVTLLQSLLFALLIIRFAHCVVPVRNEWVVVGFFRIITLWGRSKKLFSDIGCQVEVFSAPKLTTEALRCW